MGGGGGKGRVGESRKGVSRGEEEVEGGKKDREKKEIERDKEDEGVTNGHEVGEEERGRKCGK